MQRLIGSTLNRKRNKILEPPCLLLAFQLPPVPVATHNEREVCPKQKQEAKQNTIAVNHFKKASVSLRIA